VDSGDIVQGAAWIVALFEGALAWGEYAASFQYWMFAPVSHFNVFAQLDGVGGQMEAGFSFGHQGEVARWIGLALIHAALEGGRSSVDEVWAWAAGFVVDHVPGHSAVVWAVSVPCS